MTASGVSTLIASANIARTDGRGSARGSPLFENLAIGQHLKLQVLRHLEQQRYEVAFGGRRHVVDSRVKLDVGAQIDAEVESKGDKLELRYLSTSRTEAEPGELEAAPGDAEPSRMPPWLHALATQYRVPLDAQAQEAIARAASRVAQPELMSRGGIFLQKLAREVAPRDLEAVYRALSTTETHVAAATQAPLELDDPPKTDDVAATLADALETAARNASETQVPALGDDSSADGRGEDDARRATRLLNLQDDGSVAWRYGTLPMLVGGQLIELDLVMFHERESQAARGRLKRLVMTLETTHFGRVHVEARAVDSRLIVTLRAPSADAIEVMSAYGGDVRAAIEQLGWSVDDVCYEIDAQAGRAAQAVVDHVLSAGSVDREL